MIHTFIFCDTPKLQLQFSLLPAPNLHNQCNPEAKIASTFFRKLIRQAHFQHLRGNMPQMSLYFGYLALNMPDNSFEASKF